MPTEKLDDINVGELLRTGFVLNTGEATALVHAVFSAADKSNPRAFPQTADDLRLTQTGELRVSPSAWVSGAADPRIAAAALLHALLPPPSSSDNAVPAPLRGLPDRLRASAAAVNNAKVQDLVAILSRYIAVDPRRVLERLAVRARTSKPRESGRLLSVVSPEPPRGAPPETIVPLSRAEDDALALFGPDAERSARSQLPSADPGIAAPAIPHEQGDRAPESAPEISPIEPEDVVVTPRPRQKSRPARRGPNSERRRSSQPRQARESASEVDPAAADRRVTKRVRRVPKVLSGPPEPDSPAEAASESAPKGSIPVARVRSSKRRASAGRAKGINGSQPTTTASDAVPAPAVGDQQASREHNEQSALVEVPSGVVAGNASPIVQTVVGEPSDLIFETSNGSPPLALEREMDVFRRPTLDTNVPAQSGGDADASRTVRSTGRRAMRIAASVMLLAASGYAGYSYTRWPGATRAHGPAAGAATPLNRDVPDN